MIKSNTEQSEDSFFHKNFIFLNRIKKELNIILSAHLLIASVCVQEGK